MAVREFIGREAELAAIERELARARPSLLVILGRRRVGKSRLLLEAAAKRPTIYYQATKIAGSTSLEFFKQAAADIIGSDPVLAGLSDWYSTLAYIHRAAPRFPGLTVIFDEFPYLCDVDSSLPSVVQKFWDEAQAADGNFNLILCGSKIAYMEALLAEKNPLHGRQNLRLDVAPLSYRETARFFPAWSTEDRLRAFAVFGGIPFYLNLVDPGIGLDANILDLVLEKGAPLADEPDTLLQAELRDVTRYATILHAIADGCTKSGDIIGRVREFPNAGALGTYVEKLAELRLIRIVRSSDATEKERDRRYYLDDPFLKFWFHFCLPHLSALASGHAGEVLRLAILPNFDAYMGDLFEWICREHARRYLPEILPVPARVIGQIWAADYDIDVAGSLLDGSVVFGECKWWKDPVGENILDRLVERAEKTAYGRGEARRHYLLYARSGFTQDLSRRADRSPSIRLVSPDALLGP